MTLEQRLVHDVLVGERFLWETRKLGLLALSVAAGVALVSVPGFESALLGLGALEWVGVLLAGALFSYGLTTVPALSVLFLLARGLPPVEFAVVAAVGGTLSDLVLFNVAREGFREEASFLQKLFHLHPHLGKGAVRALRALSPVVAGIILASPIPDEVAAAVFGSVKYDVWKFALLGFAFKAFAMLALASAAGLV